METTAPRLLWSKCSRNTWCKLFEIDLESLAATGVYVIWHGGYPSRVVHVGYGDIASEFAQRRRDPEVLAYVTQGPLFVTWAAADPSSVQGIARHLAEILHPRVASPASDVPPVAANSPF